MSELLCYCIENSTGFSNNLGADSVPRDGSNLSFDDESFLFSFSSFLYLYLFTFNVNFVQLPFYDYSSPISIVKVNCIVIDTNSIFSEL